jgi:hypothetical protein
MHHAWMAARSFFSVHAQEEKPGEAGGPIKGKSLFGRREDVGAVTHPL